MSNLSLPVRWLLFVVVTVITAILLMIVPRRIASLLFVIAVIYPVLTAIVLLMMVLFLRSVGQIGALLKAFFFSPEHPDLAKRRFRLIHILEIALILLCTVHVTRHHFDFHPDMRVRGHEIEWLTGHGQVAYQGLRDTGRIPLWNPYYRQGEPLIDNAFSYILNPFSSVPHLLFGATQGTKYSITLNAGLAAVGGWFLGWVLGLSGVGRLTLALLILGKGNMHTNFDGGYYQLATQQVYFAWAIAGTLGILKTTKRWAIGLTGVSMALMFHAGNLWHLLPTVICIGVLMLLYGWSGRRFDRQILRRMTIAVLITLGLCAVTMPGIIANFGLIEAHPDEARAGWEVVEPNRTYLLPFISDPVYATVDLSYIIPSRGEDPEFDPPAHFYYSYVAPWWLVLLILVPVPFFWRYRKHNPDNRRIWIAGLSLYVLFTMWGMGGTPIFIWLYDHVPHLAQWRFVPRALGMASFWIAVLVAIRLDALLRILVLRWEDNHHGAHIQTLRSWVYPGLLIFFVGLGGLAIRDVNNRWLDAPMLHMDPMFKSCMAWLNKSEPDSEHWLWVYGYDKVTHMIENDVRMMNIEADFLPGTERNTIGAPGLDARFRFTARRALDSLENLEWFLDEGYRPLETSPSYHRIEHCIYQNPDYELPYAFMFDLDEAPEEFETNLEKPPDTNQYLEKLTIKPVLDFARLYDVVGVRVKTEAESPQVLVIQELAFPGWQVWVDGEPYNREIFAKLNAVILPADGQDHEVIFAYRPMLLYIGGIITIITAIVCGIYLLCLDRLWSKSE